MSNEDKQLLLTDLYGRLPYKVKCDIIDLCAENDNLNKTPLCTYYLLEFENGNAEVKPYLRPMSSMTKDEEETECYLRTYQARRYADFCNSKHLDYRGLIEKGLALEAPEGMYDN